MIRASSAVVSSLAGLGAGIGTSLIAALRSQRADEPVVIRAGTLKC